ncbi:MAG TPA: hypothetical protein VEM58_07785 [Streptosporangiaceae bacterium]|nr:hypothetical protein [Streptosporangiaceae bacterium]
MFPRQLDEVARQHARTLGSRAKPAASPATGRGEPRPIRKRTGWTLVAIGLRIAASGGR